MDPVQVDKEFHGVTLLGDRVFERCRFVDVTFSGRFKFADCTLGSGCDFADGTEVTGTYTWLGHLCQDMHQVHTISARAAMDIGHYKLSKRIMSTVNIAYKLVKIHACDVTKDMVMVGDLYSKVVEIHKEEEEEADRIVEYVSDNLTEELDGIKERREIAMDECVEAMKKLKKTYKSLEFSDDPDIPEIGDIAREIEF